MLPILYRVDKLYLENVTTKFLVCIFVTKSGSLLVTKIHALFFMCFITHFKRQIVFNFVICILNKNNNERLN